MGRLRFSLIALAVLTDTVPIHTVPIHAAEDAGAQLVAICASCHRLDGRGKPSIAGMPANDLKDAMWVFRSDESSDPVMHAVSLTFSEAEIEIIADRLSHAGSPPKP